MTIEQQNNLKQTVQAILNLISSTELVSELSTLIKNDINSSLSQNADLSNKVAAAATLLKATQNSGEINAAIDGVKGVMKDVTEIGKTRNDTTIIKNNVLNSISLNSESRSDIEDYVDVIIKQQIEQITINDCVNNSNALNEITLRNVILKSGSKFEIIQENILTALYKCVITSAIKSEDLQNISLDTLNTSITTQTQGATVSNDLSATSEKKDIQTNTSLLDSLGGIFVIIIIIAIIGGTMYLMNK